MNKLSNAIKRTLQMLTITLIMACGVGTASAATVSIAGVPQADPFDAGLLLVEDELVVEAGQTPTFTTLKFPLQGQFIIRSEVVGGSGMSSSAFLKVLSAGDTDLYEPVANAADVNYRFAARFLKEQVIALPAAEEDPFFAGEPMTIFSVSGLPSVHVTPGGGPSPIPLPGALPLLACALGGFALLGRRKTRAFAA